MVGTNNTSESSSFFRDEAQRALGKYSGKKKPFYADLRIDLFDGKGASALNGTIKSAQEDFEASIGARVYASGSGFIASGHAGTSLDLNDPKKTGKNIEAILARAHRFASYNLEFKKKFAKKHPVFGKNIQKVAFSDSESAEEVYKIKPKKKHEDVSLEELIRRVEKNSKNMSQKKEIASNDVGIVVGEKRKIFASTHDSLIEQVFPLTEGFVYVAAKGKAVETYYDWLGNYKGPEVLEGENEFGMNFEDFCEYIANGTIEVSNAPAMKTTQKPVTVITDPWFNALLSHEIMGHPSEADRALKRESAWAGRAWWFGGMNENKFGEQVASEQLTVFSDPLLEGYGHYKYDDEGVRAKKVFHIKNGVLDEFLNSRETATILGKEPNGGMRAMSSSHVPLIRMNNTAIANGDWKKEEIFEETKNGYYLFGQKTPSIGETRQNFKITCWKLYKIENGEPVKLFRQGGITADSHTFFMSIDAVGNDFNLFNIPNCGKGTPMQTMRVANGGPHIRAKAVVTGSHKTGK